MMVTHQEAQSATVSQRHEYYCDKHKPFDFEEELELIRQKAILLGFQPPDPKPTLGPDPTPAAE